MFLIGAHCKWRPNTEDSVTVPDTTRSSTARTDNHNNSSADTGSSSNSYSSVSLNRSGGGNGGGAGGGGGGGGVACSLHVHYHACGGGWRDVSTAYMLGTGHANYAETNNIVLFHPQTIGPPGDSILNLTVTPKPYASCSNAQWRVWCVGCMLPSGYALVHQPCIL
jgi:hypothetical protein